MTCGNSKTPSIEDCRLPIAILRVADCRVEIRDCLECDCRFNSINHDLNRQPSISIGNRQFQSATVNLKRQSATSIDTHQSESSFVDRKIGNRHSTFGNGPSA